jgi:hypothetical protein
MYDTASEHAAGLTGALLLLVFAWLLLRSIRILASRRVGWAQLWIDRYDAASPMARLASALMLTSAAIHLALVPGHEDGITGTLFIVDGLGFMLLAIGVFLGSWWRRPAALWLSATILAYPFWLIAGWETPDQVGIACKLVELIALGLTLRLGNPGRNTWPRRIWRAVAYPVMVCITTLSIWLGGFAHPDAIHAHAGAVLQPVAAAASPDEQAAAGRLLEQTRASLLRYRDPATAVAAGFKPGPASNLEPLVHFENKANAREILDPERPQALVYARTHDGLRLVGAMFQMPAIGQWGPDPGGPLTQWHQHEGICFSPFGIEFSFETPFWTCPVGSTGVTTPPMLHVWVIDNGQSGPFAAELDPSVKRELLMEVNPK